MSEGTVESDAESRASGGHRLRRQNLRQQHHDDDSGQPHVRHVLSEEIAVHGPTGATGTDISSKKDQRHKLGPKATHITDLMSIRVVDGADDTDTIKILESQRFKCMPGVLGKGGFGIVKKGIDCRTNQNQEVAIKIMKTIASKAGEKCPKLKDIKNEIENMSKLKDHANIIHLIDYFCINNSANLVVIVMEFCDAGTLGDMVRRHGSLNETRVKRFFGQIADAINWMHAKGIAHRDLKLDNILLKKPTTDSPSDQRFRRCKIIDFGLSRIVFSNQKGIQYLQGHAGTRAYMSPEIISWDFGDNNKDNNNSGFICHRFNPFACDIWALGICLYVMLIGRHPFRYPKSINSLNRMKEKLYPISRKIPFDAQELIRSLLDPDPHKRITTRGVMDHEWIMNQT